MLAQGFADGPFSGAESIDCEHKVAEFDRTDAASLDRRVLFGTFPVPVDGDQCRRRARFRRDVGIGGDEDPLEGLKDDLLDVIAVPLDDSERFGFEWPASSWSDSISTPAPRRA